MKSLRNMLMIEMDDGEANPFHASHDYPGHDYRMESHERRIQTTICECGSGKPYGECCVKRSDNNQRKDSISYSLPAEVHPSLRTRNKIEDTLRVRTYNVIYRSSRRCHSLLTRFSDAIIASARTATDSGAILQWDREFNERRKSQHLKSGKVEPVA